MKKSYVIASLFVILLTGCHTGRSYFPPPSQLPSVRIYIIRFDEAIINIREESVKEDVQILYDEYPDFMPIFVEDILGIPCADTAYLCQALPEFLSDTVYGFAETNRKVKQVFADTREIEEELTTAFSRIQYLYPDLSIPAIYFFISGFNASIYFFYEGEQSAIAVGTDMYLGSDYEYYNRVVYDYQKQTMRKECVAADVVSAFLFRNLPYEGTKNRLLDNMIYRGKIMYLLSQLLDEKEYEIMGYTREQWDWCKQYERNIWNRIMDKKDLFKTEPLVLSSYLNDGPFTSEISQDSPARLGTWVGWQITKSYMEHNQQVSLQELIDNHDAQNILENSFYKP